MRQFIFLLLFSASASAQAVSVGFKSGLPVTAQIRTYGSDANTLLDTGRWTVGPTVELRLIYGFSVEADALYGGYRVQQTFASPEFMFEGVTSPAYVSVWRSDNKIWDFPVLLKYRFGSRSYRPFVDAGYTWRHRSSDLTSTLICLGSQSACSSEYFRSGVTQRTGSSVNSGPTAGVGVEFKYGRVTIAPEARFTHLSNPTTNNLNLLVGFTF